MEKKRCTWVGNDEIYIHYHDKEWGVPVKDDQKLFEFLILEGFQAGLSWIIILKKRENFRKAFSDFDYKKIALYNEVKIQSLLKDEGIIRNQLKIKASISNSIAFMKIQDEFGSFANYIWGFTEGKSIIGNWENTKEIPATSDLSDKISKDLKKRGFKFVGSTIIYSFLQAVGILNDHTKECFLHQKT